MRLIAPLRQFYNRKSLKSDALAGVTLGVESVPDGMSIGVLAGTDPINGVYAYMMGGFFGAFFTGSMLMSVQATSAMSLIVSDVDLVTAGGDAGAQALATIGIMTGLFMVFFGWLGLGKAIRFVPDFVMHIFAQTVGLLIILGELSDLTGYDAQGDNKVAKVFDLARHYQEIDMPSVMVGLFTIAVFLSLKRTRVGAWSSLLCMTLGSIFPLVFGFDVATVSDISVIPDSLPTPLMPDVSLAPLLVQSALALAIVGLIQGAVISRQYPNPDGTKTDFSTDFYGQGMASIGAAIFRGLPAGGSFSATGILASQGAQTRLANLIAALTIAVILIAARDVIGQLAMPAIAGFLTIFGVGLLKPSEIAKTWKSGWIYRTGLLLLMGVGVFVSLQTAVMVGSVFTLFFFVVKQSDTINAHEMEVNQDGICGEKTLPAHLDPGAVVLVRHYGSLFYASSENYFNQLPKPDAQTKNAVVILYMRGVREFGSTVRDGLLVYSDVLQAHQSRLMLCEVEKIAKTRLEDTPDFDQLRDIEIFVREPAFLTATRKALAEAKTV